MDEKKILVVYYSRTGFTKKVAEYIASGTKCDVEEIIDTKNRSGIIGWIMAGRDATLKKLANIKETVKNPEEYDLVIIGTPIWASRVSAPIRTYISNNKDKFKEVAFFCTQAGNGGLKAFGEMEELIGKPAVNKVELLSREVAKGEWKEKIKLITKV